MGSFWTAENELSEPCREPVRANLLQSCEQRRRLGRGRAMVSSSTQNEGFEGWSAIGGVRVLSERVWADRRDRDTGIASEQTV